MRPQLFIALAIFVLASAPARGDDGRAFIAAFDDRHVESAAPDGATIWLLEKRGDDDAAVVAWDFPGKKVAGEVALPKGPTSLAVVNGKLVVACTDAVAIVDRATMKVVRSVETKLDGKTLHPTRVLAEAPPGKAVVVCHGDASDERGDTWLVEIDLESGIRSPLARPAFADEWGNAAFAKDAVLLQERLSRGFGPPSLWKLSELRAAKEPKRASAFSSFEYSRARSINGGAAFVLCEHTAKTANSEWTTIAIATDGRELWRADGELLAVHPTRPVAIVVRDHGAVQTGAESRSYPLVGLHTGNGSEVWQRTVEFRKPVSCFPTSCDVFPGEPDRLLVHADYHKKQEWASSEPGWIFMDLPSSGDAREPLALENTPPLEVRAGATFEFTPVVKNAPEGARIQLARFPDGMTMDPTTHRITWTPGPDAPAKSEVSIHAVVNGERTVLVTFTLVVRGVKPASDGKVEPEKLAFGDRIVDDVIPLGDVWFLLERRDRNEEAKVLAFDPAKNEIAGEVKVPKGACDAAAIDGKLVVACRASGVVVLVDPATKKVAKAFEVGESLFPTHVSRQPAPGTIAVAVSTSERFEHGLSSIVEIDLATGALRSLQVRREELIVAGDTAIAQDGLGGHPEFCSLAALRGGARPDRRVAPPGAQWDSTFGPFRVVRDGLLVTDGTDTTHLFTNDAATETWSLHGRTIAVHPTKPVFVTVPGLRWDKTDLRTAERRTTITGRDVATGKPVFRCAILHPDMIERLQTDRTFGRIALAATRDGDFLIYRARSWWRAPLPAPGAPRDE